MGLKGAKGLKGAENHNGPKSCVEGKRASGPILSKPVYRPDAETTLETCVRYPIGRCKNSKGKENLIPSA
ncbi:hypothetical protein P8452_62029 [Trifolium repens]|jgi:hypothetical protein|nr:hypothetical protein P8452_62029 [Trifolium repens]